MKPGMFGVTIYKHGAVKKPCNNCPFLKEKQGQPYLSPERMEGIKFAVTMGQPFYCHKTVYQKGIEHSYDPDGFDEPKGYDRRYKPCAGAIEFAEELAKELGVAPNVIENTNVQTHNNHHHDDPGNPPPARDRGAESEDRPPTGDQRAHGA